MKATFTTLLLFFAASPAFAANFTDRVEVPAQAGTDCATHANHLATTFSQSFANGVVQNVTGICIGSNTVSENGVNFTIDTVIVSYSANSQQYPQHFVISSYSSFDIPSDAEGIFESYTACAAQIQKQATAFQTANGVAPFDVHCEIGHSGYDSNYNLVVDYFGRPKQALFVFSNGTQGLGDADATLMASAQTAIQQSGGTVVYQDETHAFYYATYSLPISQYTFGYFDTASECTSQLNEAITIAKGSSYQSGNALCTQTAPKAASRLVIMGVGIAGPGCSQPTNTHYSSFASCVGDKSRVEANFTSNGAQVTGAICEPNLGVTTSDYIMEVCSKSAGL